MQLDFFEKKKRNVITEANPATYRITPTHERSREKKIYVIKIITIKKTVKNRNGLVLFFDIEPPARKRLRIDKFHFGRTEYVAISGLRK